MPTSILGTKIGMTQIFDKDGYTIPATIVQTGPCFITQIKKKKKNGYNAIQLGYHQVNSKHLNKANIGHLQKTKAPPLNYLSEYRVKSINNFHLGDMITVNEFKVGEVVNISGKTIGKGFTGYQKRHNFHRGPMSHGSKNHRQPGSIGPGTTPGRVFPGKRMAGRFGSKTVTIKNLTIIDIDTNQHIMLIKGSIPGTKGTILNITQPMKYY